MSLLETLAGYLQSRVKALRTTVTIMRTVTTFCMSTTYLGTKIMGTSESNLHDTPLEYAKLFLLGIDILSSMFLVKVPSDK